MIVGELVREALRNLGRHKLRSFLTALGIVFGVASVMTMVATGEGARRQILAQIQELGIRNVIVNAKKPPAEQDSKKEKSAVPRYGLTFTSLNESSSNQTSPLRARNSQISSISLVPAGTENS